MVKRKAALLLIIAFFAVHSPASGNSITNLSDLTSACQCPTNINRRFEVSGRLVRYFKRTTTREWIFTIAQGDQTEVIYELNRPDRPAVNIPSPHLNDYIRLSGTLYEYEGALYPGYTEACVVTQATTNDPVIVCNKPSDLYNRKNIGLLCRVSGTIRDFFRDESDPGFIHLSIMCAGEVVHAMIHQPVEDPPVDPDRYIGANATVTGLNADAKNALRRYMRNFLVISGVENVILSSATESNPSNGLSRVEGDVLCVWQFNQALLKTTSGEVTKVRFVKDILPCVGQRIVALGIPETDLYFMNLVNASWKPSGTTNQPPKATEDISLQNLLFDKSGYPMIKIKEHGKTLRLSGIVRYLPQIPEREARFQIESSGGLIPIDIGVNREVLNGLTIGSRVSVTGTCVLDIDSYGIGTSIPQARGFFLVLHTPDDLVILSRPPWWTPVRLLIVIGALILLIAAILIWNFALKQLAERRGQALADEQVKSVTSELKVYERTHLAVELHDSLSQTLSGVSMQIDAVKRFAGTNLERMNQHLEIAAKTLKSCRDELRNCLLDLRSNALEEPDMNAAIRKTLEPYLDDADIAIRFFIPREIFSDNTAHTVLRIVRELVVNAIRHGMADKIRIAGSIEGRTLMFSVRDNGCGFEPDNAPGIADGHFGLQGIRERIDELGGTLEIASTFGKGCKAIVTIELTQDTAEDTNV